MWSCFFFSSFPAQEIVKQPNPNKSQATTRKKYERPSQKELFLKTWTQPKEIQTPTSKEIKQLHQHPEAQATQTNRSSNQTKQVQSTKPKRSASNHPREVRAPILHGECIMFKAGFILCFPQFSGPFYSWFLVVSEFCIFVSGLGNKSQAPTPTHDQKQETKTKTQKPENKNPPNNCKPGPH